MKWEFIFNTNHGVYMHAFDGMNAASKCGYLFLNWNGKIITVEGQDTGIKVTDCY